MVAEISLNKKIIDFRSICSRISSENHVSQDHCYLYNSDSEEIAVKVEVKDSILTSTPGLRCNNPQYIVLQKKNNIYSYSDTTFGPNIVYLPAIEYCTEHSDLFLHEDEKLVKPGDKFDNHNDFIQYVNENAKRWYFYYKCSDSRKSNTEHETYIYTCVYLRNKEKYIKKGLRKRTNNIKTNCPCKIKLKHLPNEKQLTVVFVCNHHDHPLSEQEFYKLQHGRRLPPYIKEEIMDLISLQVEMDKIKKYVQMQTGFNMNRTFFYQIERTMRLRNLEKRHISQERLMDLSVKMSMVDESCLEGDIINEKCTEDNLENVGIYTDLVNKTNYTHSSNITNIKQSSTKKYTKGLKSNRNKIHSANENTMNDGLNVQDVIVVQESLNSDIQNNLWIGDQCVRVLPHSSHRYNDNVAEGNTYYTTANKNDECDTVSETNESAENCLNYNCVAYETVVTDSVDDNRIKHVANDEQISVKEDVKLELTKDNYENVECETQKSLVYENKEMVEFLPDNNIEFSGYINFNSELGKDLHDCNKMNGTNDEETIVADVEPSVNNSISNVEEQSGDEVKTTRYPLVPVFDVYMKDGNVTGFVVNDDILLHNSKQNGIEKGVQTNKMDECTTQNSNAFENNSLVESNAPEIYIQQISRNTYQKHEYIHKYNIDQYMGQPHFPTYINKLSQEIHIEPSQMIKNVYSEKAMFKMTTTQRGKEGNTRIWYLKINFE